MSYCRWSSDGFKCDVYVYEDVSGGWTCHVASRKVVNFHEAPPQPGFILEEDKEEWMVKHRAYMHWLENDAIRENIGLEFDGRTFNTDTATEMGNSLHMLKEMGYQVPQYAIDSLWEEGLENGEQGEI